ncbi:MAG TPA: hypothetical protein ACN46Q_05450 [Prochlorococcus sp.]
MSHEEEATLARLVHRREALLKQEKELASKQEVIRYLQRLKERQEANHFYH